MRIKHLLYLLLALPLAFVACNDPEEPKPAVEDPVLNVTETTLNFVAEGAEGTQAGGGSFCFSHYVFPPFNFKGFPIP